MLRDVLSKVDHNKKVRIINASMKEFGEKGFDSASTNNIVKLAGISKGLLFHYFPTKKDLYDYVEDFTFTTMINRMKESQPVWDSDLINRIMQITKIKMGVLAEYPDLYDFGTQMYANKKIEDVMKLIEKYDMGLYANVFVEGIDTSNFREGLDEEFTRATIQRALEKKAEEMMNLYKAGQLSSMEEIVEDFEKYADYLRTAFYK
jgi:AcrR family transcriptional regulator